MAIASKWRTAFVDPPTAIITAMAFSNAFLVIKSNGLISFSIAFTKVLALFSELSSFSKSSAAIVELWGRLNPKTSMTADIVFAVNIPPQLPAPGMQFFSTSFNLFLLIFPDVNCPTASKALTTVKSSPSNFPGLIVPPYMKIEGIFILAIASMAPGIFLSQPPIAQTPSILCALQAVSIESAITSRETKE